MLITVRTERFELELLNTNYRKLRPQSVSTVSVWLLSAHSVVLGPFLHRRNGPNFGRVFLMLNYTDITQNTYIQS